MTKLAPEWVRTSDPVIIQYCTGKARRVIECTAIMNPDDGYAKARQLLSQRFGHDFIIAQAWIKKVTDRPQIRPNDREGMQDYADTLQNCKETLRAMDKINEINTQSHLFQIVANLPTFLQTRWRRVAHKITSRDVTTTFNDVVDFVTDCAEELNDPFFFFFLIFFYYLISDSPFTLQ